MQLILKFICLFVSLFVIVNGCYAFFMPPAGDEPLAVAIIAVGIFMAILTFTVAQHQAKSDG